ncbi:hypothetical protein EDEG_02444 [Edhazardia aedis USNM 41457]|uniref:ATP-dependent helicase HrpA n=1 Tax=Edhazardia aedis (strain USNM 41457) TaxID=1003232 RepID=J9D5Y3_EDHAE|nr:hypothetical protein EDEG_02444 [Edhazardia aedis USNM 41457]|eukprot:EJW03191.1 hypothetical protein EDEG_02444 [Edhazardia aedis USNM 41457]
MNFINEHLVIKKFSDNILTAVKKSPVTIIKGPTGCGKSTFVPKLIYDSTEKQTRIALIQPRRIAVLGLYKTISSYIKYCGYKMRFDHKMVPKGHRNKFIRVLTDGMLINEILNQNIYYDYIIIDEVHERSIRTDIILGIIKNIQKKTKFKLILMSATIDTSILQNYFNAEVVNIYGKKFKSQVLYEDEPISNYIFECFQKIKIILMEQNAYKKKLEQISKELEPSKIDKKVNQSSDNDIGTSSTDEDDTSQDFFEKKSNEKICVDKNKNSEISKKLDIIDNIKKFKDQGNNNRARKFYKKYENSSKKSKITSSNNNNNNIDHITRKSIFDGEIDLNGDILVFLPGEEDIHELFKLIRKLPEALPFKLFASSQNINYSEIFGKNQSKLTRIFLSTNICETSLTLPGVKFVIDTGLKKEKIVRSGVNYLIQTEVHKENADQRMGRCSRVSDGICFRLFTKEKYKNLHKSSPEIENADMNYVFLAILGMNLNPLDFDFVSQPNFDNAKLALHFLKKIGCLEIKTKKINEIEENLEIIDVKKNDKSGSSASNTAKKLNSFEEINLFAIYITEYGRKILKNPLDVNLSHFYEICKSYNIGTYGAILISFISIENYNFVDNQDGKTSDIVYLLKNFIDFHNADDLKEHALMKKLNFTGYLRAHQIYKQLIGHKEKNTRQNLELDECDADKLEKCFSKAFTHNIAQRQTDGSYKCSKTSEIVHIHPSSFLFRKREKKVVFVDVFCTSKMYTRIVNKFYP